MLGLQFNICQVILPSLPCSFLSDSQLSPDSPQWLSTLTILLHWEAAHQNLHSAKLSVLQAIDRKSLFQQCNAIRLSNERRRQKEWVHYQAGSFPRELTSLMKSAWMGTGDHFVQVTECSLKDRLLLFAVYILPSASSPGIISFRQVLCHSKSPQSFFYQRWQCDKRNLYGKQSLLETTSNPLQKTLSVCNI